MKTSIPGARGWLVPGAIALSATVAGLSACGGGSDSPPVAILPPPNTSDAGADCSKLVGARFASAQVTAATMVTTPTTLTGPGGTGTVTVSICRVQATASSGADSQIHFEVWLPPTADAWTGRLKAEATGGYLGGVAYARMADQIKQGFVEVGSDLGHSGGQSPSWDLDPQKVDDYGYRAHYYVATAAKAIVTAYYGRPPSYSYFDGCSGGGRQAHMVASRYPQLFDGILAGDPSMFYPDAILELMWLNKLLLPQPLPAAQTVPAAKLALVAAAANTFCDAKDGLADGQITDPRACRAFDPGTLQCKAGDAANCLTADQVSIVREVYRGPHSSTGTNYWPGPYVGSEGFWIANFADSQQFGNFAGDVVYGNTAWNYRSDLNYDTDYSVIKDKLTPLTAAPTPDLSAFKARGGKMLQYHGWTDPVVTGHESPSYFAALSLVEKYGTAAALDQAANTMSADDMATLVANSQAPRDYFRLFMVPNMAHCGGGNGANAFGESAALPSPTPDADHDAVRALVKWVEQGVPPEKIVATKYTNNDPTQPVIQQRPLCAYPDEAVYDGKGDVNSASSFSCQAAPHANLVPSDAELGQIRYSVQSRTLAMPTQ